MRYQQHILVFFTFVAMYCVTSFLVFYAVGAIYSKHVINVVYPSGNEYTLTEYTRVKKPLPTPPPPPSTYTQLLTAPYAKPVPKLPPLLSTYTQLLTAPHVKPLPKHPPPPSTSTQPLTALHGRPLPKLPPPPSTSTQLLTAPYARPLSKVPPPPSTSQLLTAPRARPLPKVPPPPSTSTQPLTALHGRPLPKHPPPPSTSTQPFTAPHTKPLILLYHKLHDAPKWWFKFTEEDFASCPITCEITNNISLFNESDLVMFEAPRFIKKQDGDRIYLEYFRDWGEWPSTRGNNQQVRMFFGREPQAAGLSGDGLEFAKFMFNYTMTFQKEADIFYPYGHVEKLPLIHNDTLYDYSRNKSKLILWVVSNCYSRRRMEYKEELEKHIQVDMFGACNKTHGDPCKRVYKCTIDMRMQYKFYLAFENHRCSEYITEKFWKALHDGLVPIVMGSTRKIYEKVTPPHSFIHVDDFTSPKDLSEYLKILDGNNTLYNAYHKWRRTYAVRWNSGNCDICRLAKEKPPKITDITKMWNTQTQCLD